MSRSYLLGLLLGCTLLPGVASAAVALKPDHPERYVVQKGDTLWDIAERFLQDPWQWPEIWTVNPQIDNPHLIFPGDQLVLTYEDGRPVLRLERRAEGEPPEAPAPGAAPPPTEAERVERPRPGERPMAKLSPQIRVLELDREAIPPIPTDAIRQFLSRPRVLTAGEFESAPYIVSVGKEHLVAGSGFRVYARGLEPDGTRAFTVYRRGEVYQDFPSGEILGYEALHVGDAVLEQSGDPAAVRLARTKREVLTGDRLFPVREDEIERQFVPRAPEEAIDGRIISVLDGVTQIGQHQVVVLNLGHEDGIEAGHVLAVFQAGATVPDPYAGSPVTLPDERAGVVMVFRPFERVSYALVMKATRAMHLHDRVRRP
ncbi:MAG: LysM peptidoglycan-binding domain-containing protein [Gammaproteobacteria bacterium]|nr:LysM peptidoglycan-binding domain-containing protein [Gammaproteobacteria bacterium]NIR81789.1 LysM peptidoglycan-binding domain-containing protein [Gammaproteobacteria bacterium]NIR88621.1 LysM peptidoglycan-binding domain-containing protein [Gammaproteobacteria bacterium]NIU02897.1 LysM peptidoglycan-binding domain-containing protein [Gammaproteobacteria bacterium]NIV50418.1 LysM peptidoglycan-binding domain-containing protein [Gammaproteobacteria bacterium]